VPQSRAIREARNVLARSREDAYALAAAAGEKQTKRLLQKAEADLRRRIRETETLGAGPGSFSVVQMRATLAQVQAVLRDVQGGLKDAVLDGAAEQAEAASEDTVKYLAAADDAFKGAAAPLALNEAAVMEQAVSGVQTTALRRLLYGVDNAGAATIATRAQAGVLARYGASVVGRFEEQLRVALVTRKPWAEIRDSLVKESPFLQGVAQHWAERIVRTELMGAYNRAGWEATKAANDELGDMVKILAATFDDRTGADSYAIHGQIRRPDEPFEWWGGKYMHPPNRPNDREVVVPHRIVWPIPEYLQWRTDGEVRQRWKMAGRKGSPPRRPRMTTVPLSKFGRESDA
jgi:hypothetical protein